MFWTEEDVQPAVNAAIEEFGPIGRMVHNSGVMNIGIGTREFGKIWYGDTDRDTLAAKCVSLGQKIQQKVYIVDSDFNFVECI
jgi:hypothetical protein